jgi:hypothetical protein
VQASAIEGSAGGVWPGGVEPLYSLECVVELVFREDGVRVFYLVHDLVAIKFQAHVKGLTVNCFTC